MLITYPFAKQHPKPILAPRTDLGDTMAGVKGLRVAFCHPDLGLGGAERLVVDAATELASGGAAVDVWTAYYDPARCFEETRGSGGFAVRVAGGWFPRSVAGRCIAICAYVRCCLVALAIVWRCWTARAYDVVVADQVGTPLTTVDLVWQAGLGRQNFGRPTQPMPGCAYVVDDADGWHSGGPSLAVHGAQRAAGRCSLSSDGRMRHSMRQVGMG